MTIDLNTCKSGDKLISRHGTELTYVRKNLEPDWPHTVRYPDGSFGTRTNDGHVFIYIRRPEDEDIVKIIPLSKTVVSKEKYDRLVAACQLLPLEHFVSVDTDGACYIDDSKIDAENFEASVHRFADAMVSIQTILNKEEEK